MHSSTAYIIQHLRKSHDNDIALTGMMRHGRGIVVVFTVTDDNGSVQHRTAYFDFISIDTDNDTLVCKWDSIC